MLDFSIYSPTMAGIWFILYLMFGIPLGSFLVVWNANDYRINGPVICVGIYGGACMYAAAFWAIVLAIPTHYPA